MLEGDLEEAVEPMSDEVAVINEPASDPAPRKAKVEKAAEPEYDGGRDISKLVKAAVDNNEPTAKPIVATSPVAGTIEQQKAVAKAWKAYVEDKEVNDFSTMTAEQFLQAQFGYNANGKEQRRNFDQLVRNAQNGHYNSDKVIRTEQEREHALRQWREFEGKANSYETQRRVWEQALTAATRNNYEPLKQILAAFQAATEAEPVADTVPEGYVSRQELEQKEAAGRVFTSTVQPKAAELAQQFSLPQNQVEQAIMTMVDRVPKEYMTWQVLQDIMNVELPNALTQLREDNPVQPTEAETTKAELAAMRQELADLKAGKSKPDETTVANNRVKAVHEKRDKAPPGVPTVGGGSGDEGADFDDAKGARDWLRSQR